MIRLSTLSTVGLFACLALTSALGAGCAADEDSGEAAESELRGRDSYFGLTGKWNNTVNNLTFQLDQPNRRTLHLHVTDTQGAVFVDVNLPGDGIQFAGRVFQNGDPNPYDARYTRVTDKKVHVVVTGPSLPQPLEYDLNRLSGVYDIRGDWQTGSPFEGRTITLGQDFTGISVRLTHPAATAEGVLRSTSQLNVYQGAVTQRTTTGCTTVYTTTYTASSPSTVNVQATNASASPCDPNPLQNFTYNLSRSR